MTGVADPTAQPLSDTIVAQPVPIDHDLADGATPSSSVGIWIAMGWLALVSLLAIFAPLLPIADPAGDVGAPRQMPFTSWSEPLGTDMLGRSVLSRIVYGGRVSLVVGVFAAGIGMIVGGLVGVVAGYLGGKVDHVVGYATDTVLAFPPLVLLLALATFLEPSLFSVTVSLAVITVPTFLRLARASTLKFSASEFVRVARLLGARHHQVVRREIVPNVAPTLVGYVVVIIPFLMVAEASLSFLGLGIRPPRSTWGVMIANGQPELRREPQLVLVPAAALFLTVFAFNVVGERIRARMRDVE